MPKLDQTILREHAERQRRRDERHKREVALLVENSWATIYMAQQKKVKNHAMALELFVNDLCDDKAYREARG